MKVNGVSMAVCPMRVERVDGAYIMRDAVSGKVIMFNRTASLIWDMVVECGESNADVCTGDFVLRIVTMFGTENLGESEVQEDVEKAIGDFIGAGLLRGV
jgi:hypothetical protein